MAPTAFTSSLKHVQHMSNSLSLLARAADLDSITPLASIFALIVREPNNIRQRDLTSLTSRKPHLADVLSALNNPELEKRQGYILAIPTTYAGLNSGPAPGTVVGITLGAIGGFVLIFFIVLLLARAYGGRVVERETIVRTHHSHNRDRPSRSRSSHMSEAPRRTSRRETVVVEERVRRESRPGPATTVTEEDEVIVEEQEDDIVEVIEEHSPERRPSRRDSKRMSGFRTVDPAEPGGGNAPRRKISRR